MKRIGIVDLGSNTARLVVYATVGEESFRLVDQIREPIRLAKGAAKSGKLSRKAIQRAVASLRLFRDYARDTHLSDVTVVATSAVRDTANGSKIIDCVRDLDLDLAVLDGPQEAAFGVLAVANSFEFDDAWVIDLGGGSAQVSRMKRREFDGGDAYPLGAVRLTEQFLSEDPPEPEEIKALRKAVRGELAEVIKTVRKKPQPLVAMGGTIRNLARAVQRSHNYPLSQVHGYFLELADLEALVERMIARTARRRARIPGVKSDRADIIVAGALVFETLLREADLRGLYVSGQGLREGLLFRRLLPEPHLVPVVRKYGVRNLFSHYPQPTAHTEHVRFLSRRLFDELKPLHGYGWEEARLLDEAATLHDIGMAVGYHSHHRHGAFLIDTATLPGMSHRDKALITLLVRFHRKGTPKPGPLRKVLEDGDDRLLDRLASCLRLAEDLDRARANRIKDIAVDIGKKKVTIQLVAEQYPGVELYETRKHAPLFQKAFGRKMEVVCGEDCAEAV